MTRAGSGEDGPRGQVILVGAGPGDPELITVRGLRALASADAVVYDALAAPELLELAPPRALRINVGRRGHEEPTRTLGEICELLIRLAREGKSVVRLKGGDPYVFGRGGEEGSACAEAGVHFEVVPGVSSLVGALAYAGIPLTDRRHSASFAVVTGHKDPSKVASETRWDQLATATDTLVVLMGMSNLEQIVERLLAGGRSPATPAAVVMNGTLPSQRVVEAPLGELARRAREENVGAPSVVVVGEVVGLREALAWYERRPLFGVRVLVTRAREQAWEMIELLRAQGAEAVVVPMIQTVPPRDWVEVDRALTQLDRYDALVFTSANAVRYFADRALDRGLNAAQVTPRVFCVGPQTAEAVVAAGFPAPSMPAVRRDADALLAEIEACFAPAGRRFLLPCAAGARDVLPEGLRLAGAEVDAVPVYRTAPAAVDQEALLAQLTSGALDVLTFTSPSTVKHFCALLDDPAREAAGRCLVAAIGPVTAEALGREGLTPQVAPERAGGAELVLAVAEEMAQRRPRGSR